MTSTFSPADLRESVDRQAKRLRDHLNLKLSHAQKVLAEALYRCTSWTDLTSRLNSKQVDKHILMLASLPKSEGARAYFNEHLEGISRSFSQHMLTNANRVGLYGTMRHVFGISDKPVDLSDIAPSIPISAWQSMGIGPDPYAVIEASIDLNGVPIRLIGTRIYMPKYYQFGGSTCSPEFAEPYCETFKTIWSNPNAWYEAACRYLTLPEDDDEGDFELLLPDEVLDDAMACHQEWLSRIAETWEMGFTYGDHDEDFLPFVIPKLGCYLVFGIPLASAVDSSKTMATYLELRGDCDNDSSLVLIDGQPLCVEWISINPRTREHDGQYPDYFKTLCGSVFSHLECDLVIYQSNGWSNSFFFIRPATQFDIDQCVKVEFRHEPGKEAIVLKTDYPEIASVVFDKVATRDVMVYPSKFRENNYLMELDVSRYRDVSSFSLSLDAHGQGWWQGSNLVTKSILQTEEGQKTLYIQVEPELLSLADTIPKKDLIDAVQCGWILHHPVGFNDRLKQPPKRCQDLKPAPKELVDLFERPLLEGADISPFDLLRHAKRVPYKRDNF